MFLALSLCEKCFIIDFSLRFKTDRLKHSFEGYLKRMTSATYTSSPDGNTISITLSVFQNSA